MLLGEGARRGERAGRAHRGRDRGELARPRLGLGEQGLEPRPQRGLALERDDQRIGDLALAQIGERVLAGAVGEVELVVDGLERAAEVQPEPRALPRRLARARRPGPRRSSPTGTARRSCPRRSRSSPRARRSRCPGARAGATRRRSSRRSRRACDRGRPRHRWRRSGAARRPAASRRRRSRPRCRTPRTPPARRAGAPRRRPRRRAGGSRCGSARRPPPARAPAR